MHYLFVGYYVDEKTFTTISEKNINNMSDARQRFEYNLIKGLHEQLGDQIDFISYVPTSKELHIPPQSCIEGAVIKHIPIQKDSIQSIISAGEQFRRYLLEICKQHRDGLRVIMYAVNPVFEYYLLKYKGKFDIKLITICSEVPKLRRYGNSLKSRLKKKILTYFNKQFDGYIFFSAEMKNIIPCAGKPSIVLEGIAPAKRKEVVYGKKNIIMYAGGLAADNQIPFLLECCKEIPELSEVWICGVGPDEEKVKQIASTDSRIKYLGRLNNARVLELEEQAKILVNFRSPNEELTKYSFPSKLLEYISSGSLVLSTRLGGIPDEYFNYIIGVNLVKGEVIAQISQIFAMPEHIYIQRCQAAQNFIAKEKNYLKQSERIITLLAQV